MKQIVSTTDDQFVGLQFDPEQPIVLGGAVFQPDKIAVLPDGVTRYSNSSYVIDTKEI